MDEKQEKQLDTIYRALFEVPEGSPPGTEPLISDLRRVVMAYKRATWTTRAVIWVLPTLAGLGVAIKTVVGWFQSGIGNG